MGNATSEWKTVEKDGNPSPDGDKQYLVRTDWGYGTGSYEYETDSIQITDPEERKAYFGSHFRTVRKDTCDWRLDFDSIGHEVIEYAEIIDNDETNG